MEQRWRGALVCCSLFVATGCSGESVLRSKGTSDAGAPGGGGSVGTSGGSGAVANGGAGNGGAANGGAGNGGAANGGAGNGGAADGGAANLRPGGCSGGEWSMTVDAVSASGPIVYEQRYARTSELDGIQELDVTGEQYDEGGTYAYVKLFVAPYTGEGTYTCSSGAARITTLQRDIESEYDTRNVPMDECTIVVTGVFAFGEVSGTFEGIPHDENGGRMVLRDGDFCVPFWD